MGYWKNTSEALECTERRTYLKKEEATIHPIMVQESQVQNEGSEEHEEYQYHEKYQTTIERNSVQNLVKEINDALRPVLEKNIHLEEVGKKLVYKINLESLRFNTLYYKAYKLGTCYITAMKPTGPYNLLYQRKGKEEEHVIDKDYHTIEEAKSAMTILITKLYIHERFEKFDIVTELPTDLALQKLEEKKCLPQKRNAIADSGQISLF